jgi:hypothetical protein
MFRPKRTLRFLIAPTLVLVSLFLVSCGGAEEQPILQKFFVASKLRDNVTLGNFSLTSFDPNTDGQEQSFSITAVTPEQLKTLEFKARAAAVKEAADADNEFSKKKKEYQDSNTEAIDRILKAEAKNAKVTGKDAAIQQEWNKWREDTATSSKKLSEARKALNEGRGVVELSLLDPRNPVDVTALDGELATKEVTVDAKIKQPDGQVVNKTLVFSMAQARMKRPDGTPLVGRWIITDFKENK